MVKREAVAALTRNGQKKTPAQGQGLHCRMGEGLGGLGGTPPGVRAKRSSPQVGSDCLLRALPPKAPGRPVHRPSTALVATAHAAQLAAGRISIPPKLSG